MNKTKKEQIYFFLIAIVVTFILCVYNSIGEFINVSSILLFPFILVFILVGCNIYRQLVEWKSEKKVMPVKLQSTFENLQKRLYSMSDGRFFLVVMLCVVICFIPAYIAVFPGTFGYDGPIQVAQYFDVLELSTHHPLLHTYLMGLFFSLGNYVFGSYVIGFAIYIVLQALLVAMSLAYICVVAKRYNVNFIVLFIGTVYVALNPFIQMITFSSTKDVLFGAFLLFFVAELINTKISVLRLIIFGILMCLFRNQGVYVILALLIICIVFKLCNRRTLLSFITIAICVIGINTFFTNILSIQKGDAREMLSVPMQQVVYAVSEHSEEMTNEQLDLVEKVFTWESFAAYEPISADGVKSHFKTEVLKENFTEYFINYVRLGVTYYKEYLQAWEWLTEGYWRPELCPNRGLAITYTFEHLNDYGIEHANLFPLYYKVLARAAYSKDLLLFQRPELCLWIMVVLLAITLERRDKLRAIVLVTYVLYFGTVLLGPVSLMRYLYPMTMATPILLALVFRYDNN